MPNKPAPIKPPRVTGASRPKPPKVSAVASAQKANPKQTKPGMGARPSAVKKFLKKYSQGMQ